MIWKIPAALALFLVLLAPFGTAAQELKIDEVTVEGTRRVDPNAVLAVVSVAPSQRVSPGDIDRDLHAIFALGRFQDVSAQLEERDGRRVLIYRVEERPLIRQVEFSGNKALSSDKLREKITFRVPEIYNPRLLRETAEAFRKAYVEEGYYGIDIDPRMEVRGENEAFVTFVVEEGTKVRIRSIRFEGNTVFSGRQLRKVMQTRERWFLSWLTGRGTYQDEVLLNDLEILADQYYNRGYVQVKVKEPRTTLSEDRRFLDIVIEIEEGPQFRVGEIGVEGDLLLPREEILALVNIKPGEVFSRQELRSSVFAVNDLYADRGYAYVNVSPLTRVDPERLLVDVVFDIEQGVPVTIDRIRIRGNTKTRDKVIRREMRLHEGDLYSATQLRESRRRINNLGFFDEVNVTTEKGVDETHMDVDIDIKERPTGMFTVGVGYSSVDGVIGQGSISQENFLGRALRLNLAGSYGSRSATYQIGVTDPYFLDRNLTVGFDLYKTRREWVDFTRKATGGNLKLGFPVTDDVRTFFLYKYEEKEILDVDETATTFIRRQEGRSTLSSVTGTLSRNTTDFRLDPSSGSASSFSLEFAGLGGTEKFLKYGVDHRHFWPVKWGTVFSLHGFLGYIQEIGGKEIPIDERYFLGGLNTIRGFQVRQVGPRIRNVVESNGVSSESFEYIGGKKTAYFNAEYLVPLVRDMGLKGVFFFDAGNAWDSGEEYFSEMRYSTGAGIRWFSPLGPLRLEWGYNLDPKEGEPRSRFDFSIGSFF